MVLLSSIVAHDSPLYHIWLLNRSIFPALQALIPAAHDPTTSASLGKGLAILLLLKTVLLEADGWKGSVSVRSAIKHTRGSPWMAMKPEVSSGEKPSRESMEASLFSERQ